jgi:hypothetical protein
VLRGRLLDTLVSWERTLSTALAERGVPDAGLLAAVGVAVFRVAVTRWLDEDGSLEDQVLRGFGAVPRW